MCSIWNVKRKEENHNDRPVAELRKELLEAVLEAWRKKGASEAGETARATFDALFGAENCKVTQQLTDLHAKKDKKLVCAIAHTISACKIISRR